VPQSSASQEASSLEVELDLLLLRLLPRWRLLLLLPDSLLLASLLPCAARTLAASLVASAGSVVLRLSRWVLCVVYSTPSLHLASITRLTAVSRSL
jgi:hypothetical protein